VKRLAPPSGEAPPATALLAGRPVDLLSLARETCRRYRDEFPDELGRYGEAGAEWCVHDNQHILNWAVLARAGDVDLEREIGWLARVLDARDFPLGRLVRDLEIAADVVRERLGPEGASVAGELLAAARSVEGG
jgi:hypothetical protein